MYDSALATNRRKAGRKNAPCLSLSLGAVGKKERFSDAAFRPLPHDQDGLLTLSVVTAVLPFAAFDGDLAFVVQHRGELPLLRRNCSGEKCLEGGCYKL